MSARWIPLPLLVLLSACFVVVVDANGSNQNPFKNDGGADGGPQATADCQVNPTSVAVGQAASFDGSGSQGAPGAPTVVFWLWNFGDQTQGTGEQIQHSYSTAGTYTTSLSVIDSLGNSGTGFCTSVVVTQ
jgi:PKD repeat protein